MPPEFLRRQPRSPGRGVMNKGVNTLVATFHAALWSQRGRWEQTIPIAVALLLLVGAVQGINALHDISSTLTRQQIDAHWRSSFDLLVRPQTSVSQPERSAGWINPQSALDSYGGITEQQVDQIRALPGVEAIAPYANVGWQHVDIEIPLTFRQPGLYRLLSQWRGWQTPAGADVSPTYVDVTGLENLSQEPIIPGISMQHLVWPAKATGVVYTFSIPALQVLVGVDSAQGAHLATLVSQGNPLATPARLTLQVSKLRGNLTTLPVCVTQVLCWMSAKLQEGTPYYRPGGVQLLRYSPLQLTATSWQLASGQLSIRSNSLNGQQANYRELLGDSSTGGQFMQGSATLSSRVVPLSVPEQSPLLPAAIRIIPLTTACAINGTSCYNGVFIRLRGAESYSQRSLALLQAAVARITARTGLYVDILDGSSMRTVEIEDGAHGPLTATWLVVGVAVQIVHGVDTLQETLLALCAVLCCLATGAAGALIGIGRRDESRQLGQLGWTRLQRMLVLIVGALMIALPGCLLAALCIALSTRLWPGSLPPLIVWGLLGIALLVFGATLVSMGMAVERRAIRKRRANLPYRQFSRRSTGTASRARILAPATCAVTITFTVFLIAIEYLLATAFHRELIVTVLGKQVGASLEAPHVLLALLLLLTALMTIGLCVILLLHGRREEIVLLAQIGWEKRDALLRMLCEMALVSALSGEIGVALALILAGFTGALSSSNDFVAIASTAVVLIGGPLVGLLLVCPLTGGLAWRELERRSIWR
ncbi:MAG TPA: FtsX-like permease family protein [Ktedonobacteraceae bacterium]|nr:FtsX-like permease family protein [Ktedonobacteraceae bacterium]